MGFGWFTVGRSGRQWRTCSDVPGRVRAHHRRQEPAHVARSLPRRARRGCRAHPGSRRVPRRLPTGGLEPDGRGAAGPARPVHAGGARVEAVLLLGGRRCRAGQAGAGARAAGADRERQAREGGRRGGRPRPPRDLGPPSVGDHLRPWKGAQIMLPNVLQSSAADHILCSPTRCASSSRSAGRDRGRRHLRRGRAFAPARGGSPRRGKADRDRPRPGGAHVLRPAPGGLRVSVRGSCAASSRSC